MKARSTGRSSLLLLASSSSIIFSKSIKYGDAVIVFFSTLVGTSTLVFTSTEGLQTNVSAIKSDLSRYRAIRLLRSIDIPISLAKIIFANN